MIHIQSISGKKIDARYGDPVGDSSLHNHCPTICSGAASQYNRPAETKGVVMESDLLSRGIELMLAGMGVVFVFLTLLVGATTLMSRVVMRYQPANTSPDNEEEIAAITAAIAHHRDQHQD
jgi:oxaloacetate decarboxylase gamma subunit